MLVEELPRASPAENKGDSGFAWRTGARAGRGDSFISRHPRRSKPRSLQEGFYRSAMPACRAGHPGAGDAGLWTCF